MDLARTGNPIRV
ncbi:hypothetical protein F383_36176 [Gossypium arboreum]|nr:hypothetical protein F383_37001 [Gossypium arboreum]KHF98775.1 hypothetical protein F383_37994 [Gossypium arboreum]KHG02960.1 hypothetical protein F383_26344 [Gossypium arboreum]KHG03592.1 hypothetical protein F383_28179 [Gossypium arboreum]KHG10625.1 hypothetical protein F383_15519 [Gossypium arboreum]